MSNVSSDSNEDLDGEAPESGHRWKRIPIGKVIVWLLVAILPFAVHQLWKMSASGLAFYYGAIVLGLVLSLPGRRGTSAKRFVYQNWMALLTVVLSAAVFFGVPQIRFVWQSQLPGPGSADWILQWSIFAAGLLVVLIFFAISFWVVPRRFHPLPDEPGWLTRHILNPADRLISWPIRLWNWLGRGRALFLGAIICIGTILLRPTSAADSALIFDLPLTAVFCHHSCLWLLVLGGWLILTSLLVSQSEASEDGLAPDGRHPVVFTLGRLVGWSLILYMVNELIWLLSAVEWIGIVSYRGYAMVAILIVFLVAAVIAGVLDYLDRTLKRIPIRLIGIPLLMLAVLQVRPAPNSDVQVLTPEELQLVDTFGRESGYDLAYHHLEMRVRSVPQDMPIVFVAASGGGSRAAIFTSLVYELLARRQFGDGVAPGGHPRTWADNIVLISSVSGGSLATAHFVHRSCRPSGDGEPLQNTIPTELRSGVVREMERLLDDAKADQSDPDWKVSQEYAQQLLAVLRKPPQPDSDPQPQEWIVTNGFTDDMCTNFMAPILRGSLSATMFRGKALGSFWDSAFHWGDASNLGGYPRAHGTDETWYAAGLHPVVLFNACDVDDGSRVAIGFPPLPGNAFDHDQARDQWSPPQVFALRYSKPTIRTSLSRAVRFSSNFPWGFNAGVVEVEEAGRGRKAGFKLIDGGVSDNIGIDSIYEFFNGLRHPKNTEGQRLLRLLKTREIVLLEIDSGAKPLPSPGNILDPVADPLQAISNAAYNNAEIAKRNYVAGIRKILNEDFECPTTAASEAAAPDAEQHTADSETKNQAVDDLYVLRVRCNHFDPEKPDPGEIMTAWALSPLQKASVIARFALELGKLDRDLAEFDAPGAADSQATITTRPDAQQIVTLLQDQIRANADELARLNTLVATGRPTSRAALSELYQMNQQSEIDPQNIEMLVTRMRQADTSELQSLQERIEELKAELDEYQQNAEALVEQQNLQTQEERVSKEPRFDPEEIDALLNPDSEEARERVEKAKQRSRDIHESLKRRDRKGRSWFSDRL